MFFETNKTMFDWHDDLLERDQFCHLITNTHDHSLKHQTACDFVPFASGDGTCQNPYGIRTEAQLRAFAHSLSDSTDYKDTYIQLEETIDLSAVDWCPIGEGSYAFRGHFDGQGHTIRGLKIGTATTPYHDLPGQTAIGYFGLFGVLAEGATIHDLTLDVEIHVVSGQSLYMAGLAGYVSQAKIENVHITGMISGNTFHSSANIFVGGICGNGYRQEIIRCSSSASIQAEALGGMAEAGGIAGFQNRGLISSCHSNGTVTGAAAPDLKGRTVLGGIAGVHAGTIIHCSSTASVLSHSPSRYVGALAGWATGISNTLESFYRLADTRSNTELCQPVPPEPVGLFVKQGQNRLGEPYGGCMIVNVYGFDAERFHKEMEYHRLKTAI